MQATEKLNIKSNNEIEGSCINKSQLRPPNPLGEMPAAQSRAGISGYNLAMFKEIPGLKIKARNKLNQQEASERFLSGQSINWLEEPNPTRIFHGVYFTTTHLQH